MIIQNRKYIVKQKNPTYSTLDTQLQHMQLFSQFEHEVLGNLNKLVSKNDCIYNTIIPQYPTKMRENGKSNSIVNKCLAMHKQNCADALCK